MKDVKRIGSVHRRRVFGAIQRALLSGEQNGALILLLSNVTLQTLVRRGLICI